MEDRELDKIRIEGMVELIAQVYTANVSMRARKNMAGWLPDLHQIVTERSMSETVTIHKDKVCRMNMGVGYRHEGSFARREYSMMNGVKYNFSDWEITNSKQLNVK